VRRSHTPIATVAAIFLVAILVAGCGGDSDENDRAAPQTTATAQNGNDEDGNGNAGDEETDSSQENPCEETICHLFKKEEDDGTLLCTRPLEFIQVPAEVEEATETGEPGEASEEEPSETVLRPRCPAGAEEIPVEGIELDERSDVRLSEDGEAAWTTQAVRIEGHLEDGTLVVDE
jgi:hypothetical protein